MQEPPPPIIPRLPTAISLSKILTTPSPPRIMTTEIQNSNPTILSDADLPTRLRPAEAAKSSAYGSGLFASTLSFSGDSVDPASQYLSAESESEGDDLLEEPIDEQEIYGMWLAATCKMKPI